MSDQAVKDAATLLERHLLVPSLIVQIALARAVCDIKTDQWTKQRGNVLSRYGNTPDGLVLWHNAVVKQAEDLVRWENDPVRAVLWAKRVKEYERRLALLQGDISNLYPAYEKIARPVKISAFGKASKTPMFIDTFRSAFTAWYNAQRVSPSLVAEPINATMTRFMMQHKEIIADLKSVHARSNPAQPGRQVAVEAVDLSLALISLPGTCINLYSMWEAKQILLLANLTELERAVLAMAFLIPVADQLSRGGLANYTASRLQFICSGSLDAWENVLAHASNLAGNTASLKVLESAAETIRLTGKLTKSMANDVLASLPAITTFKPVKPSPSPPLAPGSRDEILDVTWSETLLKFPWVAKDPAHLDEHALRRVLRAGPDKSHLQSQILAELAESYFRTLLQHKLATMVLGIDLPEGCLLEFVPGHAVSVAYDPVAMRAPQVSDGLIGYYQNGMFQVAAILEIRVASWGIRDFPFVKKKLETLTRQERTFLRAAAEREHAAASQAAERTSQAFKKEVDEFLPEVRLFPGLEYSLLDMLTQLLHIDIGHGSRKPTIPRPGALDEIKSASGTWCNYQDRATPNPITKNNETHRDSDARR
jgi:hypothetical protein